MKFVRPEFLSHVSIKMEEIVAQQFIKDYPMICKKTQAYEKLYYSHNIMKAFDDARFYCDIDYRGEQLFSITAKYGFLPDNPDVVFAGCQLVRKPYDDKGKEFVEQYGSSSFPQCELKRENLEIIDKSYVVDNDDDDTNVFKVFEVEIPVSILEVGNHRCMNVRYLNYVHRTVENQEHIQEVRKAVRDTTNLDKTLMAKVNDDKQLEIKEVKDGEYEVRIRVATVSIGEGRNLLLLDW